MPDAFDQFFKLMGTTAAEQLNLVRLDPAYQTINEGDGHTVTVHADLAATKAEFEKVEPGAGAALQRYVDSGEETYKLAIEHFLYTNFQNARSFTNRAVTAKVGTFVGHLLNSLDAYASRFVKSDELRKVLDFPAVFLGASPYETPSMYHLMTHVDMNVGVFYPMGGFYEIIRAIESLARSHGVEIHTASPVTAINVRSRARSRSRCGLRRSAPRRNQTLAAAVANLSAAVVEQASAGAVGSTDLPGRSRRNPAAAAPQPALHEKLENELRLSFQKATSAASAS
jgi:phytoene desaturase